MLYDFLWYNNLPGITGYFGIGIVNKLIIQNKNHIYQMALLGY